MFLFQVTGKSKDTEPSAAFLQFAKGNPILCTKVTGTRAVIGFVEIRGRIDGGVHELNRKFNGDTTNDDAVPALYEQCHRQRALIARGYRKVLPISVRRQYVAAPYRSIPLAALPRR